GWLMDRYVEILRWSLAHRWKTMLVGVGALVATVFAFMTLPMQFQPTTDTDYSQIQIEMAPGTTLQQTQSVTEQVAALLRQQPEVKDAFSDIKVANANIFITLHKDRERTSVEFERAMAPELNRIADARVSFRSQEGGSSGRE